MVERHALTCCDEAKVSFLFFFLVLDVDCWLGLASIDQRVRKREGIFFYFLF